jgi:hypothetical protein
LLRLSFVRTAVDRIVRAGSDKLIAGKFGRVVGVIRGLPHCDDRGWF